jgi:hypothetical protein
MPTRNSSYRAYFLAVVRPAVYLYVACPITLTRARQEIHHQLMMARLVSNSRCASSCRFGTKGPAKEWFEWCCLGPNVVFHGVKTPSTKTQYNLLVTPEKATQYFNEHLSKRALMNLNGNRWVGTVLYNEPYTRFESQKYSFVIFIRFIIFHCLSYCSLSFSLSGHVND